MESPPAQYPLVPSVRKEVLQLQCALGNLQLVEPLFDIALRNWFLSAPSVLGIFIGSRAGLRCLSAVPGIGSCPQLLQRVKLGSASTGSASGKAGTKWLWEEGALLSG